MDPRRAARPILARLGGRRAELRQAVRVTAGAVAAFAAYQVFSLPQGYWAVFTVIIVMQGSLGGTLGASVDRMVGTLLGRWWAERPPRFARRAPRGWASRWRRGWA